MHTIRYFIIEDEYYMLREIESIISELRPQYQLAGSAEDIVGTMGKLPKADIDLIVSDVRLCDGNVFDAYDDIRWTTPTILATGYEQYLEYKGKMPFIDVILKPISKTTMEHSLTLFEQSYIQESNKL